VRERKSAVPPIPAVPNESPRRRAIRPIEAFKAAVRYVRNTSKAAVPDLRSGLFSPLGAIFNPSCAKGRGNASASAGSAAKNV
jgi:hypothetical protein